MTAGEKGNVSVASRYSYGRQGSKQHLEHGETKEYGTKRWDMARSAAAIVNSVVGNGNRSRDTARCPAVIVNSVAGEGNYSRDTARGAAVTVKSVGEMAIIAGG